MLKLLFILQAGLATHDAWTKVNTTLELALAAETAVDILHTRSVLTVPGGYESNPLLGKHPGGTRLYLSAAGAVALHAIVAWFLPSGWRETWQLFGISSEMTVGLVLVAWPKDLGPWYLQFKF